MTKASGESQGSLTLLLFLTTSCQPCQPLWEMIAEGPPGRELGVNVVVVAPSPSMEDERKARAMTPPGVGLLMSSSTWFDYGVGQAGTAVLVRHSPRGCATPAMARGRVLGQARPEDASSLGDLMVRWLGRQVPGASEVID